MIKVVSVETMRQIEAAADKAGLPYAQMMENAGRAAAERALLRLTDIPDARVTVLVGKGNNGGDGLVAGRIIAQESSAQVRFYLLEPRAEDDPNFKAVQEMKLFVANAADDQRYRVLHNFITSAHVVIDALYGIGFKPPFKGDAAKVVRAIHAALADNEAPEEEHGHIIIPTRPEPARKAARPYIIAVDCPSGLDNDTGEIDKNAILADETVTFIAAKPGLFAPDAVEAVGKLVIATIGISEAAEGLKDAKQTLVDSDSIRALLPARPANSNKGTFGKALIAAGSVNYTGAAALSAESAYRIGAGLVTVGAPAPVIAALASRLAEPTWLLLPHDMGVLSSQAAAVIQEQVKNYNALLLGPGWGQENTTRELLEKLFQRTDDASKHRPIQARSLGFGAVQAAASEVKEGDDSPLPPLVIDADGLNLLAKIDDWWKLLPENTIITPHPGEMGRLAGIETDAVQKDRWGIAAQKSAEWNVIVVLKGAHTLVAAPDGRTAALPFKTAALATAGTGDILAGAIVGLLAQGLAPYDAALVAGYLHGLAGEIAAEHHGTTRSVIAGDVLRALPDAFRRLGAG